MMKKKLIRLTESELNRVIENAVRKILVKEDVLNPFEEPWYQVYKKWHDGLGKLSQEELEELYNQWNEMFNEAYPLGKDKSGLKIRRAVWNRINKNFDVEAGKTGPEWEEYDSFIGTWSPEDRLKYGGGDDESDADDELNDDNWYKSEFDNETDFENDANFGYKEKKKKKKSTKE